MYHKPLCDFGCNIAWIFRNFLFSPCSLQWWRRYLPVVSSSSGEYKNAEKKTCTFRKNAQKCAKSGKNKHKNHENAQITAKQNAKMAPNVRKPYINMRKMRKQYMCWKKHANKKCEKCTRNAHSVKFENVQKSAKKRKDKCSRNARGECDCEAHSPPASSWLEPGWDGPKSNNYR